MPLRVINCKIVNISVNKMKKTVDI